MSDKFHNSALDRLTGISYVDKLMRNNPIAKIASNPIFKMASQHQKIIEAATPFHNLFDSKFTTGLEALKIDKSVADLLNNIPKLDPLPKIPAALQIDSKLMNHFKYFEKFRNIVHPSWEKSYGFINAINNSLSSIPKPHLLATEVAAFQSTNAKLLDAISSSAKIGLHNLSIPKNEALDELISSTRLQFDELKLQNVFQDDTAIFNSVSDLINDLEKLEVKRIDDRIVSKVLSGVQTLLDQNSKNERVFAFKMFLVSIIIAILIPIIQSNWNTIVTSIIPTEENQPLEKRTEERKLLLLTQDSYLRAKPDSCDDGNRLSYIENGTFLIKIGEVPYWNYVVDISSKQSGWISKRSVIKFDQ